MGEKTGISWTATHHPDGTVTPGSTWNPIRSARTGTKDMVLWGCEKVSPGCDHCYSSTLHQNHGGDEYPKEGVLMDVREHAGEVRAGWEPLQLHEPTLTQPLRWQKPRRIFVCSMTDLFGDWVPDEWIDRVFREMAFAGQHQFQVLTKRAKRMRDYLTSADIRQRVWESTSTDEQLDTSPNRWGRWPLPNVWLGVSVESQAFAWRLNYLMETPGAVRWVSAEPLLEDLDLAKWWSALDWIVVGGESGPGFRPMNLDWARFLRDQAICGRPGGPAFFYKQGAALRSGQDTLLDGREWHEYPEVAAA